MPWLSMNETQQRITPPAFGALFQVHVLFVRFPPFFIDPESLLFCPVYDAYIGQCIVSTAWVYSPSVLCVALAFRFSIDWR